MRAEHRIYTVAEFDADPDAGTPLCLMCKQPLGVKRAIFSPTGRDEWWCDNCGRCVVTLALTIELGTVEDT
jgi:hypothetical protein